MKGGYHIKNATKSGQPGSHTPVVGGDAMKTRVPSLDEFPEDVQDVVYEILAAATLRAIRRGELLPSDESEIAREGVGQQ